MAARGVTITFPGKDGIAAPASRARRMLRSALLVCGILAAVLYVAMMQAIRYDGYNWISQTPSELSAIGAPTRTLWFWLAWVYTALMLASGLLGFVWPFAPMHQREVLAAGGGTLSDTLHIVLAFVTVPLFLLTVGFGAAAFGRRFRLYSMATIVIALAFGVLTGLAGPRVAANLPTPYVGLWERINIGMYMIWLVVLAVVLLRPRETRLEAAA